MLWTEAASAAERLWERGVSKKRGAATRPVPGQPEREREKEERTREREKFAAERLAERFNSARDLVGLIINSWSRANIQRN